MPRTKGSGSTLEWARDVLFHGATRARRIVHEADYQIKTATGEGYTYEQGRRDAAQSILSVLERAEEGRGVVKVPIWSYGQQAAKSGSQTHIKITTKAKP